MRCAWCVLCCFDLLCYVVCAWFVPIVRCCVDVWFVLFVVLRLLLFWGGLWLCCCVLLCFVSSGVLAFRFVCVLVVVMCVVVCRLLCVVVA